MSFREVAPSTSKKCDYTSEFSDIDSEADFELKFVKQRKDEIDKKPFTNQRLGLFRSSGDRGKPPSKRTFTAELDREERKRMRYHGLLAMDAFTRHQKMVNDYLTLYGGKREDFQRSTANDRTDSDVVQENNKFLWDDEESSKLSWEDRLAKKYWDKLYKEYAITDLSRFKENKIALRWRIEKEVVVGKGQFLCGNRKCNETDGLRSWEVNFSYSEKNEKKNALVKVRLCPECSYKLNYHHKKREVKRQKKIKKAVKKRKDKTCGTDRNNKSEKLEVEEKISVEDKIEKSIWSGPVQIEEEKSREDEFDEYFEDLFI